MSDRGERPMPIERFKFIAFDKASQAPAGLVKHYKDHWWITHPDKGVAFFEGKFAQANTSESIARSLAKNYEWAEVKFMPSVFISIDPRDYV